MRLKKHMLKLNKFGFIIINLQSAANFLNNNLIQKFSIYGIIKNFQILEKNLEKTL